jgi:RNA 2',3'-cyclic 3'-phosphodiesterase
VSGLPDKIRAFVALRMGAEVEDALAGFIETLRESSDGIRWIRRANLHLTLRFLGDEVAAAQLELLSPALEQIAAATAPFSIELRGTGVFPDPQRPRVVWVGLKSDALIALAARVEAAAVEAGFAPERRAFTPHLTIGRVRNPRAWRMVRGKIAEAAGREFGTTRVDAMMLYQSTLGPEASTYRELARHELRG